MLYYIWRLRYTDVVASITVVAGEMESGCRIYLDNEFHLDSKWLIDPRHLLVGPKLGEGAHAKVYEGK